MIDRHGFLYESHIQSLQITAAAAATAATVATAVSSGTCQALLAVVTHLFPPLPGLHGLLKAVAATIPHNCSGQR